jgi:hypothetical protein
VSRAAASCVNPTKKQSFTISAAHVSTTSSSTRSKSPPRFKACFARAIHQNAPHGFRRRAEEMRAILPRRLLIAAEVEPSLMHQGRGLEGMTRGFVRHFVRGHPAKFVIDQRQQLVGGLRIAMSNGVEDLGGVTHSDPGAQPIPRAARKPKTEVFA